MSEALLILFTILLIVALLYSFRLPSLVIALGIATYGLKQIISIAIPLLQIYDTIFNYLIAGIVIIAFIYGMFTKSISGCHVRNAKHIYIMIWAFFTFFWVSSLWSPFKGSDSWHYFPYFAIYFAILPFLMGDSKQMIQAFQILWILLFIGAFGLLLSPYFESSSNIGRMVVKFTSGTHEEANPLALADTGIFMVLTSLLVFYSVSITNNKRILYIWIKRLLAFSGIVLGLNLSFLTSRGEIIAGIICGCFFIALIKSKNIKGKKLIINSTVAIIIAVIAMIFVFNLSYDKLAEWSPRLSQESLDQGSNIRKDLVSGALEISFSSPQNFIVGIGARGCEEYLDMYPHNNLVQALAETGLIGFILLGSCYFLTFRFGFRTLSLAKKQLNKEVILFVSFSMSLLLYDLIIESKKGSLIYVDGYMWLVLAVFAFDRAQISMHNYSPRVSLDDFRRYKIS